MIPGAREIPDPQAEMERLAAARHGIPGRAVRITAEKTASLSALEEFSVTVERDGRPARVLSLSAGEYAALCALLAGRARTVTFEDETA